MKTKKHFEPSDRWFILAYIAGFSSGVLVVLAIKILSK
jgi:hypothetical protein